MGRLNLRWKFPDIDYLADFTKTLTQNLSAKSWNKFSAKASMRLVVVITTGKTRGY